MITISKYSTYTSHSPADIFKLWVTPSSWPQWDPEVKEVSFSGSATLGMKGKLKPTSGPASTFEITALEPDSIFTTTSKLPGAKLSFEHRVKPAPQGAEVSVIVAVDGLLASLWSRILKRSLAQSARSNVTGLLTYLDAQ